MKQKMYENPGFTEYRPQRILELCEFLTPVMNKIHNTDYSCRFWTILLKSYAKTCVNRENIMSQKIIESRPLLLSYNSWSLPSIKDRVRILLRYYVSIIVKSSSVNNVYQIIRENDHIGIGSRSKTLERYDVCVSCPEHIPLCISFLGRDKRKIAYELSNEENTIFYRNLIRQIPRFYIENFEQLKSKIKLIDPIKKCFYAEHIGPFMQMLIALYVEHGAMFCKVQSGGFVGETNRSVSKERYADIDKHLTYGWKIHEKDEPSKAYRLEEFKNKYVNTERNNEFDLSIIYNQVNNQKKKKYYKEVSSVLFEEIDYSKFPDILLRPRGHTKRIDNSGELSFLNQPDRIRIDAGMKPMAEIVKNTRVVVHWSHPSTNFLECVYVNHPVVAILRNNDPTEIIKPFYKFFLENKVMHENAISLIEHLNRTNIEKWWQEVIEQPMYKQFKYKFARSAGHEK